MTMQDDEDEDPREIAREEALAEGDFKGGDGEDDDVDDFEYDERSLSRDPDEVEADDQLLLDRKELREAGLDLDNPDGFADEFDE